MNSREQFQITDSLAALQARGDHFTRQLLQEKQRVSQYETDLKKLNDQVTEVREDNKKKAINLLNKHASTTKNSAYQRVDGIDPTRLAEINQKKLVNNLESRLNKTLVRQNSIQSENNSIKAKIDKFRRKVHNDSINRKETEKRLKEIQGDVGEIMKRAASVSEQREKIMDVHNQVVRENLDEREKFNEEYTKLSMYIGEQNQLLETSIAMVASDVVTKLSKIDDSKADEVDEGDNLNPIEEIKVLDTRLAELEEQYEANRETLKQAEEKNRSYQESFSNLQRISGLTCTDDIIKAFVQHEEESFSLFNYIQTVNQECDRVLDERTKLGKEITCYSEEQDKKEMGRKAIVDEYKKRLADVMEEKEELIQANRERKMTVLEVANNVNGLYKKLRCRELEKDTTGNPVSPKTTIERRVTMFAGEQISERNILNHMELIENRAMQIITEYAETLNNNKKKSGRRLTVGLSPKSFNRTITTTQTHASRDTYISDEEYSDDDDGSGNGRPVSVHDMRKQAAEKLKRPKTPERKSIIHSFFQ